MRSRREVHRLEAENEILMRPEAHFAWESVLPNVFPTDPATDGRRPETI